MEISNKLPDPSFVKVEPDAPCELGNDVVTLFSLTMLPLELIWNWLFPPTDNSEAGAVDRFDVAWAKNVIRARLFVLS
jgi:hypothetical protein